MKDNSMPSRQKLTASPGVIRPQTAIHAPAPYKPDVRSGISSPPVQPQSSSVKPPEVYRPINKSVNGTIKVALDHGVAKQQTTGSQSLQPKIHSVGITPSVLQQMKKSKKQREHEKKLKTQRETTEVTGVGSVTCGRRTWACFNIQYDPTGHSISANFSKPWPTLGDIPVDSSCTITINAGQYQGNMHQLDVNPAYFTRGNFNNVTAK